MLAFLKLWLIELMYKLTLTMTFGRDELPDELYHKHSVCSVQNKEETTVQPSSSFEHLKGIPILIKDVVLLLSIIHDYLL